MTEMCIAAANYIIELTNRHNAELQKFGKPTIVMSCKRLNKLLYFSNIEYMNKHGGKSMFNDVFFAWDNGPVIPSVYYEYMPYQYGKMYPISENGHRKLSLGMKRAIKKVVEQSYFFDTDKLILLSHIEFGPWSRVYNPNDPDHLQKVSYESIYDFYKGRDWRNP